MTAREKIDEILSGRHPALGHSVEIVQFALIIISVVSIGIETLPGLPEWVYPSLVALDLVIVLIFTAEYVLRIYAAPARGRYIFSFYGLVDVIAIAPFWIGLILAGAGIDLRALRLLRLMRLFLLLKMTRYTTAIDRMARAFRSVREEVIVFSVASVVVLYVCALVVFYFEHEAQPEKFTSVFDAMWWAAVTLTTVGYGDIYPVTAFGRLFTVLMLFVALGIIAVPTGLVASALTHIERRTDERAQTETAAQPEAAPKPARKRVRKR